MGESTAARGLAAAFMLGMGLLLHREGAGFSWEYHNDEPSKVRQVLEGWRNYRHPPLMLDAVVAARAVAPGLDDPQAVVEWGRGTSAFYGAAAVAVMADAAWMAAGPWAGLGVGLVLLCHGPSYEMAHYFKEDSLFLLGVAMLLHAVVGLGRGPRPSGGAAILTAGWVCVGAKWIGWLPWLAAAIPAWRALAPWPRWRRGLALAFFLGVAVAGARYLWHWEVFALTGREEWDALWSGDYAAGVGVPHGRYFALLAELGHPALWWTSAGLGLAAAWRRMPGAAWALLGAGAGWLALAWVAKYSDRYAVPLVWLMVWLGVAGAAHGAARMRRVPGVAAPVAACLMAAGLMLGQWDDFQSRRSGFATDSRAVLQAWLVGQDTEDWRLARDEWSRVGLPSGPDAEESFFAADLGTMEGLRARGITHVAVCYEVYHRYVDGMADAAAQADPVFRRRAAFYRELLERGRVVWAASNRHPKPLHPGLSLVDIRCLEEDSAQPR
jgi:hypothetical protein